MSNVEDVTGISGFVSILEREWHQMLSSGCFICCKLFARCDYFPIREVFLFYKRLLDGEGLFIKITNHNHNWDSQSRQYIAPGFLIKCGFVWGNGTRNSRTNHFLQSVQQSAQPELSHICNLWTLELVEDSRAGEGFYVHILFSRPMDSHGFRLGAFH